ncbi:MULTISPECIES: GNAT family N-acetyltransferase [Desulfobacula]|uniref:N-acetylglutamate synthase, GNAT family n=1 Tax=Desulfobacula phenolica TaxID=90732 RepID=A0A1H2JBK6_9BACT|nr:MULTISPECIES: GNAT family N-acetyltransferase [Desulfobacula]SDU53814.1 N-acetylglutamate synthase, GNAT family [Desulfobacula phenolica]
MENTVKIRQITFNDSEAIQYIRKAISDDDTQVNYKKTIERQISEGASKFSLVAEINGNVVGYILSTALYAGFGIKKSAWIMDVGVHPDYMGQGIGLKLAGKICDICKDKGIKAIYSSVLWDSTDVLSFFKKLGFERSNFINLKKKM